MIPTEDDAEGNSDREGEMMTMTTNDTPPPLTSNCSWGGSWVEWVGDNMEGRWHQQRMMGRGTAMERGR